MTELFLKRRPTIQKTTLGELFQGDVHLCFTLEDVVREIEGQPPECWKINGETAIPRGKYQVILEDSPRFGVDTLTLKNVLGFENIRIHSGNKNEDTEGCLIVGENLDLTAEEGGGVVKSRIALAKLKNLLVPLIKAETKVNITIS